MSCVPDQSLNSSLAATESFPIICIDTMDAGLVDLSKKQRQPQITNPTEDEITLPVIYNELFADLTDEEFAKRLLQTDDYKSICNGAALFHFQCRSTWEDEVITVETSVQIPKVALSFTVIPPLPLLRAIPLTLALLQGKAIPTNDPSAYTRDSSDAIVNFSYGFLTLNKTRCAVPLLQTDPIKSEYPIIGIWARLAIDPKTLHETVLNPCASASLQALLTDPSLWTICLQYLYNHSDDLSQVATEENTFLLAIFPTHGSGPTGNYERIDWSDAGTTASGDDLLPLFLEVKKLGDSVGVSLPTGCYRTVCSMDTSKENRDRLFENSDTMVQCRFESTSPLDTEEISSISFHVNRDIFNGVHQFSSHSEHTTPEGKTVESKYSDNWDEAADIEQHTNEINLDTDSSGRKFEGKMNNRYETKRADFEEEKDSESKGLHNDDESDTSEIYQNEELEQPTPIPETRAPLPYARDNKSQKTSASQERHNFPAAAPLPTKRAWKYASHILP